MTGNSRLPSTNNDDVEEEMLGREVEGDVGVAGTPRCEEERQGWEELVGAVGDGGRIGV